MRSSEFVPLAGDGGPTHTVERFRPLVDGSGGLRPGPAAGGMPAAHPAPAGGGPAAPAPAPSPAEPERIEEQPAYRAGFAAGRAAAQADVDLMQDTMARALEGLAEFQRALRTRYERELLQVALGVARKVVQHELQERPEIWLAMIRAAVQQAVERERIVVRVPSVLGDLLRARFAQLRSGLEDVKELEIVDDPALPPGGCVVESRWGEVDIGAETQLAAAERALVRAEE